MDSFGAGGSFTEFYAADYEDDAVLMGHDGPGHIAISERKIKVRPLRVYHGKVGQGLSVEMSVKHGPVTLLSIVQTVDGKLKLLTRRERPCPAPFWRSETRIAGIGSLSACESFSASGVPMAPPTIALWGSATSRRD